MIRKYLRSHNDENQFSSPNLSRPMRLPLSAVENLQISPMKVEDDVVIMDGFFISASKRNEAGGGKIRSSDSSGKSSTSPKSDRGGEGVSSYKMEKCLGWEKAGKCRYGSKCQYAHAQEELHPLGSRLNNRNSLEPIIKQPYLSPQSSNISPINTFAIGNVSASSVNANATSNLFRASPSPSPSPDHSTVSARTSTYHSTVSELTTPYHSVVSVLPSPNHSMVSALAGPKGLNTDWSPMDDAINASDPMSREDADNYIHMVLYGPTQSKRLPVFVDTCSDYNSLAHLSLQSKV